MILFERRSGCKCVSLHQQPQCCTLWASLAFQVIQSLFLLQTRRKGWWGFVEDFFWSHSGAAPQSGILSKTAASRMNFNFRHAYNIVLKVKTQEWKENADIAFIRFSEAAGALLNIVDACSAECVLKSFRNGQILLEVDRLRCRNTAVIHIQMSPARYYWQITALIASVLF